ncbi:hypothetical protein XENTR_v10011033 [Xenopus tropicalis]|nr:hypothetical protein XENTR_v10011033 [Xenopus tropicalis]
MIEVDARYQNKLCGLCGDYNGAPVSNEFYLNDMPLNPIQFGNMQHINDPAITCTNVDESQQMNVSSCGKYYSVCQNYLSQSPFSSCQDLLDVTDYVMACMLDVCSCSSADISCLCSTLTEYSRQCTHAGGSPQNWRTDDLCPKQCPGNMVYKESGSPCISTCSHREVKSLCEEHDVDGCFCPDGTVWDDYNNAGCISISECHCKYQDKLYAPGSKILNDCEQCSCNAGKWTCTHGICPKVCSIEGGAHFKTFDGKPYKFHGNSELTPCNAYSRETCLKTIQFYTDNNQNVLSIRADGSVLLNDLKISLPHVTGTFSVIQPTESNIFVKTKFDLQIQIYLLPLMQLYISMDNSAKNTFEGLCGNFNYKEGDDFITSAGIEESTASAFANTWKIQSTCQDSAEVLIDPCSFSMETKIYAENWCSKLRDSESPFWKCHFAVDPTEYYKRCEYDTCSCSHSEACMCATLSSYARACAAKGIILWDWRKGICDKDIPSCPASQIYFYNITTCQPSCRSLALGEKECDSKFTPIDGCGCPDGMYVNEKDGCVPISECSCYHQGMYLRPNEVFYRRDERWYVGTGCISGCVCPEGLLDDGHGGCVQERSCPCSYNNKVFAHGSRLIEECKSCTCESGLWSCIQTPCYGTCTIYGSGHYITFDKKFYDFDGSCEFVVAQDYCEDALNGTFRIITENIPCGTTGVTCSKSIKIYLGNTELKLTNSHMEKKFGESETEVKYRAREVGLYLLIHTSDDVSLIWDKKTSLLIRLPSSYKGKVCGLCGNYDDNANNDFLTSQSIQASNVMPFGNSWKRSNDCPDANSIPQPCLAAPHRRSWAEKKCDIITNDVFKSCHSKVDPKPFYDACVNDVCSCDTGGDCECFCTAVAAYAQLCAKADVCVHWRTPEICPIFCDYYNTDENECMWHYFSCGPEDRSNHHFTKYCSSPPVTHLEGEQVTRSTILEKCYKFVCDGNCGEIPATEVPCTTTPTTTPTTKTTTPTTTKSTITTISTTTPCMCGGWGDHYLTFDGTYYTYQGNCTYVLVEEIVKTADNFGIYLDNYDCEGIQGITCPRNLTVRHETQEIIISLKTVSPISLQTHVNGNLVLLPYTKHGVNVYKTGIYFVVEIPELKTNVTYDGLTFTVKLPYGKFYNNIHGQCGTCTNNQADDLMMANGKVTTNTIAMADSFMVHNPLKPHCKRIPPVHPTIPPTCKSSVCDLIMGSVFQKCHEIHSPEPFYKACLVDSCNKDNSHKQCTSLQHYASICGDRGVCIQWRSHAPACPFTCPSNKVYDACGPALPKTCQTTPTDEIELKNDRRIVEGCFCAKGSMPFSMAMDTCVSECGCVGPDNVPRKYGESFEFNCETCICLEGGSGITCHRQQCHHARKEECTREGFYQVTQISPTNKCCEETVCRCDPRRCSRTFPKCGPGFELKGDIEEGHCCPTYACKPKHVCVSGNAEYLPGSHVYTEKCENCVCAHDGNNFTIACHPIACNIHCPAGFKVKKNSPSDCCGTCQQTNCVVNYDGSHRLMNPGDELPSMNDNCTMYKCSLINDQFITTVSQTSCPTLNEEDCEPGSIHRSPNGCCRTCIHKNDSCKIQAFDDYLTYQGCTSVTRVKMSRCEGSCKTSSMYSAHAQTMSHTCSCCQEVQTTINKVKLRCPDGTSLDHKYIDVQECKCTGTKCPDRNV